MVASLKPYVDTLDKRLHQKFNRPIVLTETGVCSGPNACARTHSSPTPAGLANQANHYEAWFLATEGKDWFLGAFWWNWDSDPAYAPDVCNNPAWKPAEDVLRKYYRATQPKPPKPTQFAPQCVGVGRCTC